MVRPKTYTEETVATAACLPESVQVRLHQVDVDREVSANLLGTSALMEYPDRLALAPEVFRAHFEGSRLVSSEVSS